MSDFKSFLLKLHRAALTDCKLSLDVLIKIQEERKSISEGKPTYEALKRCADIAPKMKAVSVIEHADDEEQLSRNIAKISNFMHKLELERDAALEKEKAVCEKSQNLLPN